MAEETVETVETVETGVCGKTAKIGPMRAVQTDLFAPSEAVQKMEKVEDGDQQQAIDVILRHVPLSLIQHLKRCIPTMYEQQNVLTYTVSELVESVRMEYMRFVETARLNHTWEVLLTWWNHRVHDASVGHTTIYNAKVAIHGYKGREKVMTVGRTFIPTRGDRDATNKIIREQMTVPYRNTFMTYLKTYALPKCLRILKMWVWDVKSHREPVPDPTEDMRVMDKHLRDILASAHHYDGVSMFPKMVKENKRTYGKRQSDKSSPRRNKIRKVEEIEIKSDDDEENPPLPPYQQPMTPPPPPPSPPPHDEDGRPPRVSRPPPTDPRVNRHQERPPMSPASIMANKEEAGRQMGLNSYVVENIVKNMSHQDWMEFLTRRQYGRAIIKELQAFLNEKYCNEEHTVKQQYYGELCNKAMYPLYYPPCEQDISAKLYHMRRDGEMPCMVPQMKKRTYFRREFADGSFPVYVSNEEYDRMMFTEREFCVEDHSQPTGYFNTHTLVENPAKYALRTVDECGNEVILRNTPRYEEEH